MFVIGRYPSAAVLFDKIHIMHGDKNNKRHLIYDPAEDKLINVESTTDRMNAVSALVYKNRILKFAGNYLCILPLF